MGVVATPSDRDYRPLDEAAKICRLLNAAEKRIPPNQQWSYIISPKRSNPNIAIVEVYDETNQFRGYWRR